MITLYQYQHCPFCLQADMVANYLNIRHQKVYLLNDDVDTCMRLVNRKSIPILELEDGTAMSKSTRIIKHLLTLSSKKELSDSGNFDDQIMALDTVEEDINAMLFPRSIMIKQPEFSTQTAREYFKREKEEILGMTFDTAFNNSDEYRMRVEGTLASLSEISLPSARDDILSWADLDLYPKLRNLTMVKDIKMNQNQLDYMEEVSVLTNTIGYTHRAQ